MWLSVNLRGKLSGVLINAEVPSKLRAVKLNFVEDGLAICNFVWPPFDEEIKRYFKEEILPKYIEEVYRLGIPDVRVRLRWVEFDGPGYLTDGEPAEVPVEFQEPGYMVWHDATMFQPGTFDDQPDESQL